MSNHAHRKRNPYYVPGNAVHSRKAQRFHGNLMDRLGRKHQIDDLRRGFATGGLVTVPFPRIVMGEQHYKNAGKGVSTLSFHGFFSNVDLTGDKPEVTITVHADIETISEAIATEIAAKYAEMRATIVNNGPIALKSDSVFGKTAVIEQLKADIASGNVVFQTTNFPLETREGEH